MKNTTTEILMLDKFGIVTDTSGSDKEPIGWSKAKLIGYCMDNGLDWSMSEMNGTRVVLIERPKVDETLTSLFDKRWEQQVMQRRPLACASPIIVEKDGMEYRYHEGHNSGEEDEPEIAPTWSRVV